MPSTLLQQVKLAAATRMGIDLDDDKFDGPQPIISIGLERYARSIKKLEDNDSKRLRIGTAVEPWETIETRSRGAFEVSPQEELDNLREAIRDMNGRAFKNVRFPQTTLDMLQMYVAGAVKRIFKDSYIENEIDLREQFSIPINEHCIGSITRRMGKTVTLCIFTACALWAIHDWNVCMFSVAMRQVIMCALQTWHFYHIVSKGVEPIIKNSEKLIVKNRYGPDGGLGVVDFFPGRIDVSITLYIMMFDDDGTYFFILVLLL
jgi:hypothetical protein